MPPADAQASADGRKAEADALREEVRRIVQPQLSVGPEVHAAVVKERTEKLGHTRLAADVQAFAEDKALKEQGGTEPPGSASETPGNGPGSQTAAPSP